MFSCSLMGQEIEPRAYAALPKNLNTWAIGYSLTRGNVLIDPVLPASDLKIAVHNISTGYLRTFGLAGKLARIQLTIPFVSATGKLKMNMLDTAVTQRGFGDARIRFGVNFIGGEVLDKKQFVHYTESTIVGASLLISVPVGSYHRSKRLNCGSNRWAIKPEIGVSKRVKRFYLEAYGGVWFYGDNNKFLGNKDLDQNPVLTVQAHGAYFFKNKMMVSMNTTWFSGGRVTIDETATAGQLNSARLGFTCSYPVARGQLLKLQFHLGVLTEKGYDYNAVSMIYQYIF